MSEERDPVEVTTRFATTVDTLGDAWAKVMEWVDRVGPDPEVKISPVWIMSVAEGFADPEATVPRRFSVVVSGMVHESGPEGEEQVP